MKGFFHPDSIAIIGASPRPGNLGRNIYQNMLTYGYAKPLYPVSPKGGQINDQIVYQDIKDIPEACELAIILTPAKTVPQIMKDCGEKGIKRIIVESGGFSELDQTRHNLEKELNQIAKQYDIRFIGPNCIGVVCTNSGVAAPFPMLPKKACPGKVSIIAQSGGIGLTYLNNCSEYGIGISKFASVGNKLNVNEQDLLAYLIEDNETETILLYLESIVAGKEICDLIAKTDKPVVVHKSNISYKSNAIAQSHTAALANDDAIVDACLKQAGAIRVPTVTECINTLKCLTMPRPKGKKFVVVSRSGGHAVVAADACARADVEMPALPKEYLENIKKHVRASVIKLQNPLDLGDLFDFSFNTQIVDGALSLETTDAMVMLHGYRGSAETKASRQFVTKAGELSKKYQKPIGLCLLVDPEELIQVSKLTDLPIFPAAEEAVRALSRCAMPAPLLEEKEDIPGNKPDFARARRVIGTGIPDGMLDLPESLLLAVAAGIPVAPFTVALTPEEAAFTAQNLGFPVVLKACGISHKTEKKGVVMNLNDQTEVEQTAEKMFRDLSLRRMVVMSQIPGQTEVIVGAKRDPSFGPLVLLGLGGVTAEVLRDISLAMAPVSLGQAGRMMDDLKGAALLKGFRGSSPIDRPALLNIVKKVSDLVYKLPEIVEFDLNPVITGPGGSVAVDARAVIKR